MSYDVKQVIVVRKDLNMRKGKIAAQTAHASNKILLDRMSIDHEKNYLDDGVAIISTGIRHVVRTFKCSKESYLNQWLESSFAKVVVSCDSEDELLALQMKATEAKILNARITDNGTTEFNGVPTITCLAIGPHKTSEIDKITGHLKLL